MGYSFYEIYITAQRAFRAMGFPFGADEDAGFMIAWLELNHFNGIKILHNLITSIDQSYDGIIEINKLSEKIDFKNHTILMKGSGLIDYLNSILNKEEKISINILNCKDSILFLPLLYKISKNINYIELNFTDEKNFINKYRIKNEEITFELKKNQNLFLDNEVKIIMNNERKDYNNLYKHKIISKKIIQANLAKSIDAEKNIWNVITKIANKTFVPESDESRNKGAGGGDAND